MVVVINQLRGGAVAEQCRGKTRLVNLPIITFNHERLTSASSKKSTMSASDGPKPTQAYKVAFKLVEAFIKVASPDQKDRHDLFNQLVSVIDLHQPQNYNNLLVI